MMVIKNLLKISLLFAPLAAYTPIENEVKTEILTPSLANRTIEKIRLNNGIEVLLVSDPEIEQSAATLSVFKGSWDEPSEHPGLAHFLEHMLFLGTEKYPIEGDYQKFIARHGGTTNAFTSSDFTSYLFSVDNDAYPEALDRFSHFFKDPLFNPSGVSRELNAVNEEYRKNIEKDQFRWLYLVKELSKPDHPFSRFNIGSLETLKDVDQETLKEWYRQNYSANLMRVALYSPLPVEQLRVLAEEHFAPIKDNQQERHLTTIPSQSEALTGQMVYVQPLKNLRELYMVWDLPHEFTAMKETQPDHLVCYILGHEGKESLLAQLKREKLAEKLACGTLPHGKSNTHLYLQITLTDEGVEKRWDVIERAFQTIAALKNTGVSETLFHEVQQLEKIEYEYQPRQPAYQTVMKDAMQLQKEGMATYPEHSSIVQRFDPEAVQALANYLTPEHANYYLIAPSSLSGVKPTKKERWFNVAYSIKPIPTEVMNELALIEEAHPKIDLPKPNPFLPEQLTLLHPTRNQSPVELVPTPELLIDNDFGELYYTPDFRYHVPKVFWDFEIKTPQVDIGRPVKTVLADLVVKATKEALNKYAYNAQLAGLNYKVERTEYGLRIQIEGYSDKAHLLLREVLRRLKELHPNEEKFAIYKQTLLRKYQNFAKEPALNQAIEGLKSALYRHYTTERQKASAIRRITHEKFLHYATTLFDEMYIDGLVYGNSSEEDAKLAWKEIQSTLGGSPYPRVQQKEPEVIKLPQDKGPFYLEQQSKAQSNAVILAIEEDGFSFKKRAAQQILMQAMGEAFYNELRTKQQTAYIVHAFPEEIEQNLFNIFAIQSGSYGVKDLLARFESFIEKYNRELGVDVLTEETFNKVKNGLLNQVKKPQKNMKAMGNLLQLLAFRYDARFDWINQRIKGFEGLSYEEFLKISREVLGKNNRRRLALLWKGSTEDELTFQYKPLGDLEQLKKIANYAPSS